MAINANGREYDVTFKAGDKMLTTTSQYKCCSLTPDTTTSYDRTVEMCGQSGTNIDATMSSDFCIGINQTYLSAGSDCCSVRLFGVSKAYCAESISSGSFVAAYSGVSTTTMNGRIMQIDNGVTVSSATHSICAQMVILGRALENGSTGTVISVFINTQLYDRSLVGTIGIT